MGPNPLSTGKHSCFEWCRYDIPKSALTSGGLLFGISYVHGCHGQHERQNKFDKFLKTDKLIIEIRSSHQSGRDTHIRQIKIFAPQSDKVHKNGNEQFHESNEEALIDIEENHELPPATAFEPPPTMMASHSRSVAQMFDESIR